MKRIGRHPEKYEALLLFDSIGKTLNLNLQDSRSHTVFINSISSSLSINKNTPIMLHGRRIEAMFGYIAASLGECLLIKQEDSGEVFFKGDNIQPPDYRIVLKNGIEFFIEVKNCHKSNPTSKFQIKSDYLNSLLDYAKIFNTELKIAIYWSKWNVWTLINTQKLNYNGKIHSIKFIDTFKINEMATIGDRQIGTTPPLLLRLITDEDQPRRIDDNGNVSFVIGAVELECGKKIVDEFERKLAFQLMLYSEWPFSGPSAIVKENELIAIEYIVEPEERNVEQGFDMLGSLSGMIAMKYNDLTSENGKIEKLSPSIEPGSLSINIPTDFKGKSLPLWQLVIEPS